MGAAIGSKMKLKSVELGLLGIRRWWNSGKLSRSI